MTSFLVRERPRLRRRWQRGRVPLALLLAVLGQFVLFVAADAATITVDRADDTGTASACTASQGDCSLRGAFAFADANPGTTITIPAGTYSLTLGELRIGTATNTNTTITGAGAATTIIRQTTANSRVINVNPNYVANVTASIAGVTITGGSNPGDLFHGAGIIGGGPGNTLNLRNCTITGNTDTSGSVPKGGGVEFAGGGFLNIDRCTIANNTAGSAASNLGVGGGVDFSLLNNPGAAGTIDATANWWGCNAGPANTGCDTIGGRTAAITVAPRLFLTVTASSNPLQVNQASALTASFLKDSAGNALTLANLSEVIGLPITFGATRGTISSAQTTIQPAGTATATFTASAAGGDGTTTVDNGTASAAITVNRGDTATTITADTPDPAARRPRRPAGSRSVTARTAARERSRRANARSPPPRPGARP
jgi:hypothetical protein